MNFFKGITASVLMLAASVSVASAAGGDVFVGEYSGNCPGSQCFIHITKKKGNNYNVVFTARDRMNYDKILCKAEIPMVYEGVWITDTNYDKDALVGQYKSDGRTYVIGTLGEIILNSQEKCGKFELFGAYSEFGD